MIAEFKYLVFSNQENGYTVARYKRIDEEGGQFTGVGYNLPIVKGQKYEFDAEKDNDSKYKKTYKIHSFKPYIEEDKDSIVNYLTSGIIKGLGIKKAEAIYSSLGKATMSSLKRDPSVVRRIPGISNALADRIEEYFKKEGLETTVSEYLYKFGVSVNTIRRVLRKFKDNSLDIIENEPFKLCIIRDIDFELADAISLDKNIARDSYMRIKAAALSVLLDDFKTGNVCMELIDFSSKLLRKLNTDKITKENVCPFIIKMIKDKVIRYRKRTVFGKKSEYIYHPSAYSAELMIAEKIAALCDKKVSNVKGIDSLIKKYAGSIELDDIQKEAIKLGVTSPVFIITGGPGTGKTTILRIIGEINKEIKMHKDNLFLSPTGRAARRITESTGFEASTIHSALKLGYVDEDTGSLHESDETLEDLNIIIDESSMIDLWVMERLLEAVENCSLGFIGDVNQLPSVGCGSILRDLIDSKRVPCVELTHIHRQADDAFTICDNALKIKEGIDTLTEEEDFKISEKSTLEETEEEMIKQYINDAYQYGIDNVKCLSPVKKGPAGVYSLNNRIQDLINPINAVKYKEVPASFGMRFREGDPVMQQRNEEEIANGDIGYISEITNDSIIVDFDNTDRVYSFKDAREFLIPAYATTVHKSQGSEYDVVIMSLCDEHGIMLKRNLLYTGITRGKHKVSLIGSQSAIAKAIKNNETSKRNSFLSDLLKIKEEEFKQLSFAEQ